MNKLIFSRTEWNIAMRYLRAKRTEGGITIMTWISLIGISLAVFSLVVTLAVRAGFKEQFIKTILGANSHVTLYVPAYRDDNGNRIQGFENPYPVVERIKKIDGVERVIPAMKGQALATANGRSSGVEITGIDLVHLENMPGLSFENKENLELSYGYGIAIGKVLAEDLGLKIGDRVRFLVPDAVKTAFGSAPRVETYEIADIFSSGRYDIDKTRIYMPTMTAGVLFNRTDSVDELQVFVNHPDEIETLAPLLAEAAGPKTKSWTWKQSAGSFLDAIAMEDRAMFIILSILVMIASMNIISGLIMLVKNKKSSIGILRTIGFSRGSILRIFFLCGATIGMVGTLTGIVAGVLFAPHIEDVMGWLNQMTSGKTWNPEVRGIYRLPSKIEMDDIFATAGLALGLSFAATLLPAWKAARLDPVEALRHD